jgi:N6-adenosine-specific RNA methylase IME4
VILADPPWQAQGGEKHYDTLPLDDILGMADAVKSLAADNCQLFLWTTNALIEEANEVIRTWGFKRKSVITWAKLNRLGLSSSEGVRNATEHLLLATRGRVPVAFRSQPSWFATPVGLHSSKPHEQYAIIDRLAGPGKRKLELFARHHQPGWEGVWGNEVASTVSLAKFGYPVPSDFDDQPTGNSAHEENGREA